VKNVPTGIRQSWAVGVGVWTVTGTPAKGREETEKLNSVHAKNASQQRYYARFFKETEQNLKHYLTD